MVHLPEIHTLEYIQCCSGFYGREEARNFLYILHLHLLTNDNSVVAFCTVNLIQTGETNYFADSVNGLLLFQDKV